MLLNNYPALAGARHIDNCSNACPKNQETATIMKVVAKIDVIANETDPCCCKIFIRKALTEAIIITKEYLYV